MKQLCITHRLAWAFRWAALLGLICSARWPIPASAAGNAPSAKPVLLYSRHYNAEGETRYLPDGTYREILRQLSATFEIRVSREPLDARTLAGVNVVLVVNPSDLRVGTNPPPAHFGRADIMAVRQFVERGGGMVIMGNQENHNLEVEDTNHLLADFGLQFTNVYTDAKQLVLPASLPLLGGLKWAYYTGNQIRLTAGHPSKPRALVENDLTQKPPQGTRDAAGILLAIAEPGRGRVVAVTDSGWVTEDALSGRGIGNVAIREHDNGEICRRLLRWAAHLD